MLMRSCIKILDEKYNLMIKRRDTIDKYDILVAYHFIIQFKTKMSHKKWHLAICGCKIDDFKIACLVCFHTTYLKKIKRPPISNNCRYLSVFIHYET